MNPITALMLARAVEQERQREFERRAHRQMRADSTGRPSTGRRTWSLRLPRFGLAGSKA